MNYRACGLIALWAFAVHGETPICISGIYPQLAVFNQGGECGIGAVVPWAGRLWWITYPPHQTRGSDDGLYSVDESLQLVRHPESVGGTHAARLIHRETRQLLIGPYVISEEGRIRALDVKKIPGRYTAWARHLTDPARKVLLYDMEGAVWEIDLATLEGRRLFVKPVPGWHGKGAWTGQGVFVIANNGEFSAGRTPRDDEFLCALPPKSPEDAGILAEWNGQSWRAILRRQFTDVSGPGGLEGERSPEDPIWAVGWDTRSLIFMMRKDGQWSRFRLPKASWTYDPTHGWFTEWPRIRAVGARGLMTMHGMFWDFPVDFGIQACRAPRAISSYLRIIPDFCEWNGRLVLASDDCSIMQNPLAGKSQSNLWFGRWEDLFGFGPDVAWGALWLGDPVRPGETSDPFAWASGGLRCIHISHNASRPVAFHFECDRSGRGRWESWTNIIVGAMGYRWVVVPPRPEAEWIRVRVNEAVDSVSVVVHIAPSRRPATDLRVFDGLAPVERAGKGMGWVPALLRPGDGVLHVKTAIVAPDGTTNGVQYLDVNERLQFVECRDERVRTTMDTTQKILADWDFDGASVRVRDRSGRVWRLPKSSAGWERFAGGMVRGVREAVTERYLGSLGGLWYEIPRAGAKAEPDFWRMKPVAVNPFAVSDFCTWRGLLVLAGVAAGAATNQHVWASPSGQVALWFGQIDDLWKMGKPVGDGGPWKDTSVRPDVPSDPYLMTGFDRKVLRLSHRHSAPVRFKIEIQETHREFWRPYGMFEVAPGQELVHEFPEGFSALWVRVSADTETIATAQFEYR